MILVERMITVMEELLSAFPYLKMDWTLICLSAFLLTSFVHFWTGAKSASLNISTIVYFDFAEKGKSAATQNRALIEMSVPIHITAVFRRSRYDCKLSVYSQESILEIIEQIRSWLGATILCEKKYRCSRSLKVF